MGIYVPNAGNVHGEIIFTILKPGSDVWGWPWSVAITVFYYILFEAAFASSPGKALAGLRVVTVEGERAPFWSIVVRNLIRPIESLSGTFLIGAIACAFSPWRQRLGDRAARTLVVDARLVPWTGLPRRDARIRAGIATLGLVLALTGGALFSYVNPWPVTVHRGTASDQSLGNFVSSTSFTVDVPQAVRIVRVNAEQSHRSGAHLVYTVAYVVAARHRRYDCTMHVNLHWHGFDLSPVGWDQDGYDNACTRRTSQLP